MSHQRATGVNGLKEEVESLVHIGGTKPCDLPTVPHRSKQPGQTTIVASVIVPTYGRPSYLRDSLASLLVQDFPSASYEIIVVDNKPTGEIRKIIQELPQDQRRFTRYVEEKQVGLHNARHAGAREAHGEILVYVDDDVIVQPKWLASIIQPFSDPQVACAGGKVIPKWEAEPPDWWSGLSNTYLSLLDLGEETKELHWPEGVYGCNMAVRRSVLFEVGGFNPDVIADTRAQWLRGDGETGLHKKIFDAGYKVIYLPQSWLYHCIPPARLKPEYFYGRAFSQGISDSYALIRKNPSKKKIVRQTIGCFLRGGLNYLRSILQEGQSIQKRVDAWYWCGKGQHQLRVVLSRKLYRHVLRDNYLAEISHSPDA